MASAEVWTVERRNAARTACASWAGTPHRGRIAIAGEGIDCVHFVAAIIQAAGIIPGIRLPAYDERIGRLRERNIIEDILLEHLHCARATEPAFGDIVICKCGRESNHIGIIIDGLLWHCPGRGRVGPEALFNWMPRVQAFLRIESPGLKSDPSLLTAAGILARSVGSV